MVITRRTSLRAMAVAAALLSVVVLHGPVQAAPVEQSLQDTLTTDEDMLLLLVPSVPIQKRSAKDPMDDLEYDLIAIPGEVLRREIRQTGHDYGPLEESLRATTDEKKKQQFSNNFNSQNFQKKPTSVKHNNAGKDFQFQFQNSGGQNQNIQFAQPNHVSEQIPTTNSQNLFTNGVPTTTQNVGFGSTNNLFVDSTTGLNNNNNGFTFTSDGQILQQGTVPSTSGHNHVFSSVSSNSAILEENLHDKRSFFQSNENSGSSGNGFNLLNFGSNSGSSGSSGSSQNVISDVTSFVSSIKGSTGGSGGGGGPLGGIKQSIGNVFGGQGGNAGGGQGPSPLAGVGAALAAGGTVVGGLSALVGKLSGQNSQENDAGGPLGGIGDFGGSIFESIREIKEGGASGIGSFAEAATGGLRYVGRLSTSILRILLQIPGIKAKVFTEVMQAATPLKTTIGDVVGENAGDLRTMLEAGSEIITDAFDILIRLVSDVLALKGRMLASFGANGMDRGASLFDGVLRIAGATVQAAGDSASAVGRGVGDVVQVVSEADIPPLPDLPNLPQLPNLGLLLNLGGGAGAGAGSSGETGNQKPFNLFGGRRRR